MRAAVFDRYGPPEVVRIAEVATPSPKDGEVLVRVRASAVNAMDWRLRKADPFPVRLFFGLARPKAPITLGTDFAGTVAAVGAGVTRFQVGDEVFGNARFGCHAEYRCVDQAGPLLGMPAGMSFEQAASIPFGAITALLFLRAADIKPGQRVLVYGASGAVGVHGVQIARQMGAHVTAVCSTANLELVRSLGADAVVDYTRADYAEAGRVYDVILDTVGKSGFWRGLRTLKRGGRYLFVASLWFLPADLWMRLTGAGRVVAVAPRASPKHLSDLKDLIEAGHLRGVIDSSYPLERIVEAHRLAESGHKRGSAVVVMEDA